MAALVAVAGCSVFEDEGPEPTSIASGDAAIPEGAEEIYDQELSWSDCDGEQCAELTVPVDWDEPDGETIEVAVLKAEATGDAIGSLVVNPGGPGGSGVDYARYADYIVSPQVRRAYDVVGFDPRGVSRSAPVDCLSDDELDDFLGMDPTPDDAAERTAAQEAAADLGEQCQAETGELLGHVSTQDAARDMDVLRHVLGDRQLTYLGKSYGTYLGTVYAELFPENVGRFVLDGAVAPDLTSAEQTIGQATGFDRATRAWAQACVEDGCELGESEQEVIDTMLATLEGLDADPLPGGGVELTEGWGTVGVAQAMYEQGLWSELNDALVAVQQGDGEPLGQLSLQYARRNADGTYSSNIMEAIYAVNCLDHPEETGEDARQELIERAEDEAPIWGRFMVGTSSVCGEWPIEPVSQPREIAAEGAAPILVVGTTRDPATPYEWAERLDAQLADSALLTLEGDGHTAYMRSNSCIDAAVDDYLLTGELPAPDARTCSS